MMRFGTNPISWANHDDQSLGTNMYRLNIMAGPLRKLRSSPRLRSST